MATRNRSARRHEHEQKSMGFRAFSMRTSSLNIEDRSIEADVSTENPVEMPDFVRGEMVPEILVSSGAILPASRQVPFLEQREIRRIWESFLADPKSMHWSRPLSLVVLGSAIR